MKSYAVVTSRPPKGPTVVLPSYRPTVRRTSTLPRGAEFILPSALRLKWQKGKEVQAQEQQFVVHGWRTAPNTKLPVHLEKHRRLEPSSSFHSSYDIVCCAAVRPFGRGSIIPPPTVHAHAVDLLNHVTRTSPWPYCVELNTNRVSSISS